MTTPRLVIGLGLAAVISTGAAVAVWQADHVSFSTADAGEPLIEGLIDRIGDVASISVMERNLTSEIIKKDGVWYLAGSEYPADPDKLQKALVGLVRLQLLEAKTQLPEKHAVIDVNLPAGPEDAGQRITLKDQSGQLIGDVVLGKTAVGKLGSGKDAQYVRRVADQQSWLAEGRVDAGARASVWTNTTPVDLPREGIEELQISYSGQQPLVIRRSKKEGQSQPAYEVVNAAPEGRKFKEEFAIRFAAGDFAQVSFEEVRKMQAGGKPVNSAELLYEKGLRLGYVLVEQDGRDWLSVKVIDKGQDSERADQIITRTKDWQFGLSESKSEQFRLNLETLLEPAEG